ncbi:putative floral homeotic protein APETALA 2-like isoform X1 [Sesbania bispinosa]|nr:putative floral homeotic protein APETALA 2-like isoform X1 [Sesbania bispinosa]
MAVASSGGGTSDFPRAHWVGVKVCQSKALGTRKSVEVSQPMKKSRRIVADGIEDVTISNKRKNFHEEDGRE